MTGSTLQQLAKGFWRILEVYLFFIVSVLGFTGLGKAPFSLNSKKDKPNGRQVERYLSEEVVGSLILPPCLPNHGFLTILKCKGLSIKKTVHATADEDEPSLASALQEHRCQVLSFFESLGLFLFKSSIPKNQFAAYLHTSDFLHKCFPQSKAPLLI
ncbi:hypothetical protein Ctha_0812 [Chloroherpeton thalassium ATCC 35110]|uniref:Uncharacterized protein n=1 Tax=Chloroherpeton thalassium (strain ATCC 35110 / GB-78) TaxID=517418 RepID=B3QWR6_CHLT3|nr:hypothetical protein [Chloroherpeton thalassium]ACF13280.1 hypothetical protein Ctha_0812 [Chloroherpeton thalassium ATCC 35110]